jgi:glucokinase
MAEAKNRVGVEASISALTAVALGPDSTVTASRREKVDRARDAIEQLSDFIESLKESFGPFDRVGIALPGLIHLDRNRVAFSTHIPDHSDVDLGAEVRSATGVEPVVENDANAAAYGEYLLGSGRGARSMFYVTLGNGVGGAFILNGEIWRGISGFAGEFGSVAINSDGMRLEDVASSANIVRRTRTRFNRDSTSSLNRFAEQAITLEEIVEAADRGDDFAALMLQRTGSYVGLGIASVINLLNIERVVIGGEIMKAQHLVLDAVIGRARELSFGPSFEKTEIVSGTLGENASAIGAALLAAQ